MNSNKTRKYELNTWLDQLPTEIILDVFDYLSSNDILYSFFDFNQRFNNLLMQQQRFTRSLELPISKPDIWKEILVTIGSQIQTLVITIDHLSLPLNLFTHLKSLIISSPYCFQFKQLKLILESDQFKNLHSLKINRRFLPEDGKDRINWYDRQYVFEKIFSNENTLEIFELIQVPNGVIESSTLRLNLNLHSLTLNLYFFDIIFDIMPFVPNLEYLNLTTETPYVDDSRNLYPGVSHIPLKKLVLTFRSNDLGLCWNVSDYDPNVAINFIKQFSSSLKCLSLDLLEMVYRDTDDFPFNGIKLQQQLLESMTKLEKFHLYAIIPRYHTNVDNTSILSTFQNQFWFDRNWFVGMHKYYLYTLPFPVEHLDNFTDFDQIKSSNDEFLNNNPRIWYNVISVQLVRSRKVDSNLLKLFKIKMPKLTSIIIRPKYPYSNTSQHPDISENEDDTFDVTLDSVTTVCFHYGSIMEDEKQWLIHALPNVTKLTLNWTKPPSPESELALVFGKKIQRLDITFTAYEEFEDEIIEPDYFPNLEYLNITINLSSSYEWLCECANYVLYLLKNVKKLKILSIDFVEMEPDYTPRGIDNSSKLFQNFHLNEIMNRYEMTNVFNYTKFLKKI